MQLTHTQTHATKRINIYTPRLETHTIPNPQPTHQLHPQKSHTPPHTHTTIGTHPRKYNLNIYIVANLKARTLLEPHSIQHTMNSALTQAYGHAMQTTQIDTTTLDATNIDSNTSYKDIPTPIQTHKKQRYYTPSSTTENGTPTILSTQTAQKSKATTHWERGGQPAITGRHTYRH